MLKMSAKTVDLVQKAHGYASNNPSFAPTFPDISDFTRDSAALNGLAFDHDSTMMLIGSDTYAAALVLSNNIRFLAQKK